MLFNVKKHLTRIYKRYLSLDKRPASHVGAAPAERPDRGEEEGADPARNAASIDGMVTVFQAGAIHPVMGFWIP